MNLNLFGSRLNDPTSYHIQFIELQTHSICAVRRNTLRFISLFLLSCMNASGLEIFMNVSTSGTTSNFQVYNQTVDGSGNVVSWGTNGSNSGYRDYIFKLVSTSGSNITIDSFSVQLSGNAGSQTTQNINSAWFNYQDSTSLNDPIYANRLGNATASKNSFPSTGFKDVLMGSANFSPTITVSPGGNMYFFRVWSAASSSNSGYGTKMAPNANLSFSVANTNISMYNYDQSSGTFSTTPATNFAPVPELPTYISGAIASIVMAVYARRHRKTAVQG